MSTSTGFTLLVTARLFYDVMGSRLTVRPEDDQSVLLVRQAVDKRYRGLVRSVKHQTLHILSWCTGLCRTPRSPLFSAMPPQSLKQ